MTSREEIEYLLNQTGRTLEGLPTLKDYRKRDLKTTCEAMQSCGIFETFPFIMHQSDVIELLIGSLRDALDKKMMWIGVKERLPEKGDNVLISLCGCNVKQAVYRGDGVFEAAYADTYHSTGMGSIVLTHWMPTPKPQKEDSHETE